MNGIKLLFSLSVLVLMSCSDTIKVRKNDESDLNIILEKSTQFYRQVKKMQLDSLCNMINRYEIKDEETKSIILKVNEGYGNLQSVEPETVYSNVEFRNGKMTKLEGNTVVYATYEKAKFKEILTFKLIGDSIKVNSYHFELVP